MTQPQDTGPLTVTAHLDRRLIPTTGEGAIYFGVRLHAPDAAPTDAAARPPLNLALVLDRSGSMARGKFDHAREAATFALRQLTERDYVGVVAYDHVIELVAPSQRATPAAKRAVEQALQPIRPRGNTNLHDGWLLGLQQIASQQGQAEASTIHRCFLLTDGLANTGITDRAALVALAQEWRRRGVATTTFGVGEDFDETLLEAIADAGGGHFYFIAEAGDIPNFFRGELGELLTVAARQIALDLWAVVERPGASERAAFTLLNRLPLTMDADGVATVDLGEMDAASERLLVARVACPRGSRGEQITLHARVRYRSADLAQEYVVELPVQTLTYDLETAVAAQPVDEAFMADVLLLQAAEARDHADAQMRAGDYAAASGTLGAMAHMLTASPYQTPAAAAEAASLEALAEEGRARGFSPHLLKANFARSAQIRKSRRDYAQSPQPPQTTDPDPNAPKQP
jgi:Ca-activated chloride channel family protein